MDNKYILLVFLMLCSTIAQGACNAPNVGEVELSINGDEYVEIGTTNEYRLVFNPDSVDTDGGVFTWTYAGFTAAGSVTNSMIQLIAPATPSTSENDKKNIKCEFSKYGWSSPRECSASSDVIVISLNLVSPTTTNYYMTMSPLTMPNIPLEATVLPELSGIEYRYQIGSIGTNGTAVMYEDAPNNYDHPESIDSGWGEATTNIAFGADVIYGGHATNVTVSLRKGNRQIYSHSFDREFYIVGNSLTTAVRDNYINSVSNENVRAIARVIAVKESGGTHFWSGSGVGTASHLRYPLKEDVGPGGGYGVMQLTAAELLDVSTIWNWQANIDAAVGEIEEVYAAAESYLNTHPSGVTSEMIRLEVYHRYNGGLNSQHYWWTGTQWSNYGYIDCPGGEGHEGHGSTHGYRDYNHDGQVDPDGNPYGVPGVSGPNECLPRAETYAEQCLDLE